MMRGIAALTLFATFALGCAQLAHAQDAGATSDSTVVEQQQSAPPPTTPAPARDAGVFGKGHVRVSLILGFSSAYSNDYLLLGLGGGYYLMNGLEAGLELLSWIGNSPTMLQITPELRYVFWQPKRLHPYLGAFYRHSAISNWPDQQSYGGRFGIMYRSGGTYVGVGGVYNRYIDCDDENFNCDDLYPEVFFALYW